MTELSIKHADAVVEQNTANVTAKNYSFWKVSHGTKEISQEASDWLDQHCLITVHQNTLKGQGREFAEEVKVDDVVAFYRSGYVKALLRVESDLINMSGSPLDEGWQYRRYGVIRILPELKKYKGLKKGWAPNYNNTLYKVKKKDYPSFESNILEPFFKFKINLNNLDTTIIQLQGLDSMKNVLQMHAILPLNQILYGPPGTGKTYHTIEAAVKAAEPDFPWRNRQELKAKYDHLVDEKRIRFVTFHQSYGYEEFVEGLSVKTVDGEAVYFEKDGVFKKIVDDALKHRQTLTSHSQNVFDSCWTIFLEQLANDEEGVKIKTKRTFFTVTAIDNGTIRFKKDKGTSIHTFSVKTLKAIFDGERVINGGLKPYYSALIGHLRDITSNLPDVKIERKNYVLIIDEINRGNISKIFGELITLIEPSKRKGVDEALALVLPYSGDRFSVPDNLYIIGTMNTADRSLAMMDTALRRRFDFVEMMPDASKLENAQVKGINLTTLLETLNNRIEVLYDREHTLGHAFFMPVKARIDAGNDLEAFEVLLGVFQNKIIPLLQEYFFEDWHKIRLVLGDNQRLEGLRFIKETSLENNELNRLFGKDHGINPYGEAPKQYRLTHFSDDLWKDPRVYLGIYEPKQSQTEAKVVDIVPLAESV